MSTDSRSSRVYSTDQLRRILHRAMELDLPRADQITHSELLETAAELGVSHHCLETALNEFEREDLADRGDNGLGRPFLTRLGILGAGTSAAFLLLNAPLTIGALTIETCSLLVGMSSRGYRRQRRFLLSNAALWTGAILGPFLIGEAPNIVIGCLAGAASSLIGSAAIVLRDSLEDPPSSNPTKSGHGSVVLVGALVKRLWRRLFESSTKMVGSEISLRKTTLRPSGLGSSLKCNTEYSVGR